MFGFKAIASELAVAEKAAVAENEQKNNSEMSVRAMNAVKRAIISGILRSLCTHLFNTVPDPKDQKAKYMTITNAMLASKDIDAREAKWLGEDYFSSLRHMTICGDEYAEAPCCSYDYLSWYTAIDNLMSDMQVYAWAFDRNSVNSDTGDSGLNDHEKELVERYQKVQNEYWRAKDEFENYFREVSRKSLQHFLMKYGTVLGQVDPEWYKAIARCAGITNQDEKTEAPEADA